MPPGGGKGRRSCAVKQWRQHEVHDAGRLAALVFRRSLLNLEARVTDRSRLMFHTHPPQSCYGGGASLFKPHFFRCTRAATFRRSPFRRMNPVASSWL
jgi:hypothetical protein